MAGRGARLGVDGPLRLSTRHQVDAGDPDAVEIGQYASGVGRFSPRSRARAGETTEIVVDVANLHYFDPESTGRDLDLTLVKGCARHIPSSSIGVGLDELEQVRHEHVGGVFLAEVADTGYLHDRGTRPDRSEVGDASAGGMARSSMPSISIAGFDFRSGTPAAPSITYGTMRPVKASYPELCRRRSPSPNRGTVPSRRGSTCR